MVQPYLGIKNGSGISIQEGINFAVAGATALDASFFVERGIDVGTDISLGVQLDWFKEILPSLCNTSSSKLPTSSSSSSYGGHCHVLLSLNPFFCVFCSYDLPWSFFELKCTPYSWSPTSKILL